MEKLKLNRNKIRIFLYIFFVFLAMFIGLVASTVKANNLSRQITVSSQRSLDELEEYISCINTSLNKALYANTAYMLSDISNDLVRDSSSAKIALATMPISGTNLSNTSRFLSQVGAFVYSLNKRLSLDESITENERNQIKKLISYSEKLSAEFLSVSEDLESGYLSLSDTKSTINKNDKEIKSLSSTMSDIQQSAGDYPTLVYDGPFSDHILNQKPKMLENEKTLTKDEAKKKAISFFKASQELVSYVGEENGDIPSYMFSCEGTTLAISKKGGVPVYMLGSSSAGEVALSKEDAIDRASQFLTAKGFSNMTESYYYIYDGVLTVNFAYFKDEIIYYSDLIKVSVNLENGNIISFDARGYIMNHINRTTKELSVSTVDAIKKISPLLDIVSSRLAAIPTDYATEKLCYEFRCKNSSNQEFLVYIDAITGEEADILILLYSDNGILTK